MEFGLIGLGRMGANLSLQALEKGHRVVGYNRSEGTLRELARNGLDPARSLEELVSKLHPPRIIITYVPHGLATEEVYQSLRPLLEAGDVVADGGNSHWLDSQRRHAFFAEAGVSFLDVGTSGGIAGARHGACFMVGGDSHAYEIALPILKVLAVDEEGVIFVGPPGSGHFVKLVHNAIEFGMVQAIAEGVELLMRSDYQIDLVRLFDNWMHGSVIRSWLVELMGKGLREFQDLGELSTYVEDTGEVKWVLAWALEKDVPAPVVSAAQTALMQYREAGSPAARAVAILRHGFGGHPVHQRRQGNLYGPSRG